MSNLGLPEFMVVTVLLASSALPVAAFVLVLLTYRKVSAIERLLATSFSSRPEK